MPHLLIVEDDDAIRTSLRLALEEDGYEVSAVASAEEGLDSVTSQPPDLMLVDLMLGGMDGFSFIRRVRPTQEAPIIVISARQATDDIVAALEAGADDYVTKPFELREVNARLRALLRRGRTPAGDDASGDAVDGSVDATGLLVLDPNDPAVVLDTNAGVLRYGSTPVHLTVTEYRLLCELASPAGRVRSRASLLDAVWDRGFFGDERIVDVHIRRLRTKVERDPSYPRLVVTVRGLGYRLDRQ